MVLTPLLLIQIALFNHLFVLSGSRSIIFASSHQNTWLLAATCSVIADLKISEVDAFLWDLV